MSAMETGTHVVLSTDVDLDDPATGIVRDPTAAEIERRDYDGMGTEVSVVVVVEWDTGRRLWEYTEDLVERA